MHLVGNILGSLRGVEAPACYPGVDSAQGRHSAAAAAAPLAAIVNHGEQR
jgi:hypothetical protein